jgi:hypothetical protein
VISDPVGSLFRMRLANIVAAELLTVTLIAQIIFASQY